MTEKAKNKTAKKNNVFDLSRYRKNVDGSEHGIWTPDLGEGARVKIRYFKSQKYQDVFRELVKENRDDLRNNSLEENKKLLGEAIARGLIVEWENIHLDGELLEFNEENAIEIFCDEQFSQFRDYVFEFAQTFDNYRQEQIEAGIKN